MDKKNTDQKKGEGRMIYDIKVKNAQLEEVSLSDYKGYVMLIVNTASKCGFTPQFKELEELYRTYKDRKFVVLGFPCNQFGGQDPGTNEEIVGFCQLNYGVSFPMMDKVKVNGEGQSELFAYLKKQSGGLLGDAIKWNFTKFLVDREGRVVSRFAPMMKPSEIAKDIEGLL